MLMVYATCHAWLSYWSSSVAQTAVFVVVADHDCSLCSLHVPPGTGGMWQGVACSFAIAGTFCVCG